MLHEVRRASRGAAAATGRRRFHRPTKPERTGEDATRRFDGPAGALNLPAIAAGPRVVAVTWGAEDLGAEIGHTQKYVEADGRRRYHPLFEHCRVQCLLAARAAGVQALDGVYADVRDAAGCRAEAADAVAYGYDGKLALHPAQLDPIHAAFSVSPAAVAKAEKIVKAVEAGGGVGEVDGQMVDRPHLVSARRILARAAAGGAPSAVSARPVRGKYLRRADAALVNRGDAAAATTRIVRGDESRDGRDAALRSKPSRLSSGTSRT